VLPLYEKLDTLCKERKINITAMCNAAGVNRSALSDYKTGRNKTISIDNLQKIADYFVISLDYLLGNTDIKEKPALNEKDEHELTFDDFTYALHNETKELTEENKQKLLEMAKLFKLGQEQDKK
jgi:transcriptional regulator with XRE-family HTH domain